MRRSVTITETLGREDGMRNGLRLAMLAWVTAVVLAAPVQAAQACWHCCSAQSVGGQPESAPGHHDSCCAQHAPATPPVCCTTTVVNMKSPSTGPEHSQCPRCEQTRPAPLGTVPSTPVLVDLGFTVAVTVVPQPTQPVVPQTFASSEPISQRPACVLFSRWLI